MAVGFATATANAILDALCRSVAWSDPAELWVKLHIGDPGAAGTANAATETTRKQATFGTAAAAGSISNTLAMTWTNVAGSEDYTHASVWDASTAGTFVFSGTITADAVTATNTFTIDVGGITVSLAVAA